MAAIPTYVVEEHHEAFFIWHYAIQRGSLAASGNTLLHVDEHADIGVPRFHRPLPPLGSDLQEVQRFTYQELACFEFIVPAIYQGIFTELVWIHGRPARKSDQLVVVRSRDGRAAGFELSGFDLQKGQTPADPTPGTGQARYFVRTVEDPLPPAGPIVLDIDLDYLSCEDAVNQVQRVEVTRDEFEAFENNRYHFLRITQGSRLRVSREDGRYYLYLRNYPEPMPTPLRVSEAEILRRVDALIAFLVRNRVNPQLIVIARSRFSGFTAADQWEFIESALLTGLRTMFELDVRTIDETIATLERGPALPATSLDRHLAVAVDPGRPESLISETQLANLHAIARLLPSALTEFFGFECRLGDADPRADFLLCAKASEGGREVLAGQRAGARLSESLTADPIWQRIGQFATMWADPRSSIYGHVDNVWLEFDMERAIARPAPSVFLGTQALRQATAGGADVPAPAADASWFFDAGLAGLIGPDAAARLEPGLRRALAALPPGAQIFQVGAMLARDAETIRICVRGLSQAEAAAFVRDVGWQGPLADVDSVIADAFARADSVDVDFDIGTEVGPKIGLECSFLPTPASQLRQRAFLDHLVDTQLCTPAKRQGLLEWPRGFHERTNAERWPRDLRQRSEALGGRTLSAFVRWLYHIKLVYEPEQPLHAKAYLAVRQFWPTAEMIKAMVAATERA